MPTDGSGTGAAQDATLQLIILALGGPIAGMPNGSGTGPAQDASLQQILALLGGGGLVPGNYSSIEVPIGLVTASSTNKIPKNAIINAVFFDNSRAGDAAYSPGTTIQVGIAGNVNLFMTAGDSIPNVQGLYSFFGLDISVGAAAAPLLVTVGGAPAVGSGIVVVYFSVPLD
jgi:hypothetical protein